MSSVRSERDKAMEKEQKMSLRTTLMRPIRDLLLILTQTRLTILTMMMMTTMVLHHLVVEEEEAHRRLEVLVRLRPFLLVVVVVLVAPHLHLLRMIRMGSMSSWEDLEATHH